MKSRIFSLLALLALVCSFAFAADVDGKWMSEAQGKGGPQTLMLKSAGDKVTGTLDNGRGMPMEIQEGMIHGSDIMFKITRDIQGKGSVTQEYKGTVSAAEIKVTTTTQRGEQNITFKKQ
jgi:hypothetical protein